MPADTAARRERLTPRFLVGTILSAVSIIALWVLSATVIHDWHVEAIRSDISPANPLALDRWEGFETLPIAIPFITFIVAIAIAFPVVFITMRTGGKRSLALLPVLLLSLGFMAFSQFSAMDSPVRSTGDPLVVEWAQERYGVELVGDAELKDSPTLVLDDGTTVVVTVIESSAGSSVILTEEELGELPVITP